MVCPVMYAGDAGGNIMREPYILSSIFGDIYFEPIAFKEASKEKSYPVAKGLPLEFKNRHIEFAGFDFRNADADSISAGRSFSIGVKLNITYKNKTIPAELYMTISNSSRNFSSVTLDEFALKIRMTKLEAGGYAEIAPSVISDPPVLSGAETLSANITINPFINLVWLGALITIAGFLSFLPLRFWAVKKRQT